MRAPPEGHVDRLWLMRVSPGSALTPAASPPLRRAFLWRRRARKVRGGLRGTRARAPPPFQTRLLRGAFPGRGPLDDPGGHDQWGNKMTMPGRSVIDFSGVDTCLSSLKVCQSYISTGMDIATNVALDLVENHNDMTEINEMGKVMRNYAAMSREVSHYVEAVEATINQLKQDKPEMIPDLKHVVEEKFKALENTNSDLDLQRNEKFVLFNEHLKQMMAKYGVQVDPEEMPILEQVDEDIAVTQSQTNFICPITQEEMKKPVKNKVCGHIYEEEAILELIRNKEQRKKKACCPKVGCNNGEVRKSHLVPDEVLKRTIDSQNKQSWSTK